MWKLRHTNHSMHQKFYNFFKNFSLSFSFFLVVYVWKNHIAPLHEEFMNGVCGIHSDGYTNFVSHSPFLFHVITIIFLYLLSTIIVCNIKKNIYLALISLSLTLLLFLCTLNSLIVSLVFTFLFYLIFFCFFFVKI